MPRKEIDYSHTIIYKITCKDENVKDVYVGHTTNFVQRKIAHKISSVSNQCKVYKVIRENGGWTNWKMEMVNFYNCKDQYEARIKEQEYFISLNATMNSIEPFPNKNISVKEKKIKKYGEKDNRVCDTNTYNDTTYYDTTYNDTTYNDTTCNDKIERKYNCTSCQYETDRKSSYDKHNLSIKHINTIRDISLQEKQRNIGAFVCKHCNKDYKVRNSLWYHSIKCNKNLESESVISAPNENTSENIKMLKSIVMDLIKSNYELQKQIIDVIEKNS